MRRIAVFLGTAAGVIKTRLRRDTRERQHGLLEELYGFTQDLANAQGMAQTIEVIEDHFFKIFHTKAAVVASQRTNPPMQARQLRPEEMEAAATAPEGHPAGARMRFLPLETWRGTVGAIGLKTADYLAIKRNGRELDLAVFDNHAALALLRAGLEEQAHLAAALQETDKLQKALLASISHNVRTPLSSILGSLGTLQDEHVSLNATTKWELLENARIEAERLNRLLGNLLDMSRLEGGALLVRTDPCDIEDAIGAALEQLRSSNARRIIDVSIPADLPFVRMDFVLIVQVIVNLLDNALKYSPEDAAVTVNVILLEGRLEFRILDTGEGIPEQHLTNVFEKFHRAGRTGETGGIGLGLSICKGLVEAHNGRIWLERREPHGTAAIFTLPV